MCGAVVHIVLGSPWPNGNAMDGPVNNFSSGAVQIQSRFPFLRAGVKNVVGKPTTAWGLDPTGAQIADFALFFFGVRRCQQVVRTENNWR